jgi:5-methylcytosine-specific restriction protein A
MNLEDDLTAALVDAYQRSGEEVGYWAHRFIRAVRRNGGLVNSKRMLKPRTSGQRAGLDALLEAGRPDLTVEAIVLQPRFHELFSDDERAVASERLGEYGKTMAVIRASRERLFPDELEPGQKYVEGARKTVRVNAYERNAKARKACISHFGTRCVVCRFDFESTYGKLGAGFIHIHHLNPLALADGEYELNPIEDLRPVCPNCHAMLHRPEKLLSITELQAQLRSNNG